MQKILALEKDPGSRDVLSNVLASDYQIKFCYNDKTLFNELALAHYDVVIIGFSDSHEKCFDLLGKIKTATPHIPVIMTSASDETEMVVKAIKNGAFDYIVKPYLIARIQHVVRQALENRELKNEIDYLRHEQDIIYNFDETIAKSPSMKEVIKTLKKFSKTDGTILMTGETGTGKSFLSGTLHFNSKRKNKPFVKINCANIPETLLESELFGHEKGAFTGADKLRIGRFEQAHGGTMFLDEIGEMSLPLQSKLLRVLEEKAFERVGGNKTIRSDVRVIAATNKNLEQFIADGKFREDLYYRINVLYAVLPPLRERKQCIEPLAHSLLHKVCRSLRKTITGFSPSVMSSIKSYHWPGNIRQLANTIERAAILEDSHMIQDGSIMMSEPVITPTISQSKDAMPDSLEMGEKTHILKALEENLWIQKDAAKVLGISPRTLNYKIKKYQITHPRWRKHK